MSRKLSNYAVTTHRSQGRTRPQKPHPYRESFERDRDRIIHCQTFRRLEGKTQVFTPGLNDNYRTRLTHSIEVAQIGRTIARCLGLNESLTEALCLGHDLGHPPFGHVGERVLNSLMTDFGGFEHNRQTLRVVDVIEHPYPDFAGLNLMYETRLGFAKHSSPYDKNEEQGFPQRHCSLEGQITDLADRIAYNCHDLEDGQRGRILEEGRLAELDIFRRGQRRVNASAIDDIVARRTRISKGIVDMLVSDCLEKSKQKITEAGIETLEDVYNCGEKLIILGEENEQTLGELEKFLMENLYKHRSLMDTAAKVELWIDELFNRLCEDPVAMPGYYQRLAGEHGLPRTVCDYIAGMTDNYCLRFLGRLRKQAKK